MSRIDDIFADLRAKGRRALIPFVCAGHPAPGTLSAVLRALARAGSPIIEVGFPYSDPIADGPVIAQAMHAALAAGMTPRRLFEEVRAFREGEEGPAADVSDPMVREMLGGNRPKVGLVAMLSISIVQRLGGPAAFCRAAKDAGFDAVLVPDLPLEEAGALIDATSSANLSCPMLVSPSTPFERAVEIAKVSTGFVYLVARVGVTGDQTGAADVSPRVERLKSVTQTPIAVGFGIADRQQVAQAVRNADAAIVGSALVRRMSAAGEAWEREAEGFVRELSAGLSPP